MRITVFQAGGISDALIPAERELVQGRTFDTTGKEAPDRGMWLRGISFSHRYAATCGQPTATRAAADELGLKIGMSAWAIIKASSIILGVD